jgi:hypothetical protein
VSHHNADIWAQTAPVAGDPVWALWPMSGAWLCLHLWEHYMFSLDKVHIFLVQESMCTRSSLVSCTGEAFGDFCFPE